jgi:outer membrane lipoprotein-sorting protein
MFREMNGFITGCIQGDILRNDNDYSKEYFENEKYYYVKLVPRSDKVRQMLKEVHIWFNRSDLGVEKLKMVESGNDYTQIMFTGKILNPDIPVEKFTFK